MSGSARSSIAVRRLRWTRSWYATPSRPIAPTARTAWRNRLPSPLPNRRSEESATLSVQAAAISLAGRRMMVVLVPVDVVRSPGEAEMLVTDLRPRFGGVDVVLMGQDDDGYAALSRRR